MKRAIVLCLALAAALCAFQTVAPIQLFGWNGARYVWLTLGQGFVVNPTTGSIDVAIPPVVSRVYGAVLTYDATADGWHLPAGASRVVVYVNGLRYQSGLDYTLSSGLIKPVGVVPSSNLQPSFSVLVDYDATP